MKKILALILAIITCLSLCACTGGGNSNDAKSSSVEDKVKESVKYQIMAEVALKYDTTGAPSCTYFVDEIGENKFEVTGKVTVRDKYGDSYTGKYDAEVIYDPADDDCDVSLEMGTLYKD